MTVMFGTAAYVEQWHYLQLLLCFSSQKMLVIVAVTYMKFGAYSKSGTCLKTYNTIIIMAFTLTHCGAC